MTTNAFIFMWDYTGIEAIVPITQYEGNTVFDTFNVLMGEPKAKNPLNSIVSQMIWRARANHERRYEIYAIDCDKSFTEEFWQKEWKENPQFCADLIREKGHKLWSSRVAKPINIV